MDINYLKKQYYLDDSFVYLSFINAKKEAFLPVSERSIPLVENGLVYLMICLFLWSESLNSFS